MTMKSVFLGAAAGIAAIGAAQAADLPMTKGEAVEYVKVCSTFGPGFFYIPGSDTCLKIGGEIRADYRAFGRSGDALGKFSRNDNRSAFNTQARIWFDARTQTDYGLLRSYFQINADSHPIKNQGRGNVATGNTFSIDKAFIQYGGLTAGYAHSFFGFYDNEYGDTIWAPYYAESKTVNLLAYTAQFGGGFSAALSIEDGRDHRAVDLVFNPLAGQYQGGQQFPDVVAQLRFDQDWGSLAIQGAMHQLRSADSITYPNYNDPKISVTTPLSHDQTWGYAVGGTALLKLPFVEGGHFIVEGQYANGAVDYLGASASIVGAEDIYYQVIANGGTYTFTGFNKAKGWSVVAELGGNLTPVLSANLVGSYIEASYERISPDPTYTAKEFTIAGNLTYTIVKGLTVAAEVGYTRQNRDNVSKNVTNDGGGTQETFVDQKENVWQAGMRLKRVF